MGGTGVKGRKTFLIYVSCVQKSEDILKSQSQSDFVFSVICWLEIKRSVVFGLCLYNFLDFSVLTPNFETFLNPLKTNRICGIQGHRKSWTGFETATI